LVYSIFLIIYLFVIEGTDVAGQTMFDFITGDLKPFRALMGTWTILHIAEISTYFICFIVQRNYPKEFSLSYEAFFLLLISFLTNSYYEIGFKIYNTETASCDNGIIPRQILVDNLRYTTVFYIIFLSQRMVYHGIPPPPADCLESLDIVMISNLEFIPLFQKFISQCHPDKLEEFNYMILLFLNKREARFKMEFTKLVHSFKKIYNDYKLTRSFEELRRRMIECETVMGRMYMDQGKDEFSGNYNRRDGTVKLEEDSLNLKRKTKSYKNSIYGSVLEKGRGIMRKTGVQNSDIS
jgi:hypothetical protein